jgi:hypothetical protein
MKMTVLGHNEPCRYCGKEPGFTMVAQRHEGEVSFKFAMHCECGAQGPICDDVEQALDAWNKTMGERK